jgi:hypothetical protein
MPRARFRIIVCPHHLLSKEHLTDDMQSKLCSTVSEVRDRAAIVKPFLRHHLRLLNSAGPNRLKVLVVKGRRSDLFEDTMLFAFSGCNGWPVDVEDVKHFGGLDEIAAAGGHLHDDFGVAGPEDVTLRRYYHYRIIAHSLEGLVAFVPGLAPFREREP